MAQCVRPNTSGTARTGPFFNNRVLRLEVRLSPDRGPGANSRAAPVLCVVSDVAKDSKWAKLEGFLIPMGGNELSLPSWGVSWGALFLIPMGGNETASASVTVLPPAGVPDPHGG